MSNIEKEIKITQETMLKNSIYRSLIRCRDNNELSISCDVIENIQEYIINDFKTKLRMYEDEWLKQANYKLQ